METQLESFSLRQQVAQRLMLGFAGPWPGPVWWRLLAEGLGGTILFRPNLTGLSPALIRRRSAQLQARRPTGMPPLWVSIDQEGGPVERLPYPVFPTAPAPWALAHGPEGLTETVSDAVAATLADLGINHNFWPTLDVHRNPRNPVIHVRAFSDDPETVARQGQAATEALWRNGVLPVGKHFPGHGSSDVDSHLDLPTLDDWDPVELAPFRAGIRQGLPALLVAHVRVPRLLGADAPMASQSPELLTGLLRQDWGFDGVVFSDDMVMGAVTRVQDPVTAALNTLAAGVDVLVYRDSTETEWAIFEAIVAALESGRLDRAAHEAAVARILTLKARQPALSIEGLPADPVVTSRAWAEAALRCEPAPSVAGLPIPPSASVLVIEPDLSTLPAYAMDASQGLAGAFLAAGFERLAVCRFAPEDVTLAWEPALAAQDAPPDWVVMVGWHPGRFPQQGAWAAAIQQATPGSRWAWVSAGMPDLPETLPAPTVHLQAGSWRPPAQQAVAGCLRSEASA